MNFNTLTYILLNDLNYGIVALILIGLFALLYFGLCGALYGFFKWTNNKGWSEKIATNGFFKNQIQYEIRHSIISVSVFGLYGLLIVFCYRNGFVQLAFQNNYNILIDLFILVVWNEIHFYFGHKLMHSKFLVKYHRVHHKSIVVTPFSTYSFHLVESVILGSVMIIPVLFITFEVTALVIFPIYSLFFNALGHSNVRLKRQTLGMKEIEISTQHNNHHTRYNANFGFASSLLDRLMRTYQTTSKKRKTTS